MRSTAPTRVPRRATATTSRGPAGGRPAARRNGVSAAPSPPRPMSPAAGPGGGADGGGRRAVPAVADEPVGGGGVEMAPAGVPCAGGERHVADCARDARHRGGALDGCDGKARGGDDVECFGVLAPADRHGG